MKIQICRGRLPTARYGILLALTASVAGISAPFQSDAADHLPLIQGVVTNELTGEPLRKAFLRLRPVSGSGIVRPAVTDIQGRFVIEHIDPGKYRLETERQGFIDSQNGSTTGGSLELSISAGHSVTGLKVKLTPQAVISGRIVDEDGDAWTHAQAGILRSSWREGKRHLEGYGGGPVDDQGRFRIGQLPPGKYYLAAEPYSDWERQNRSVLDRSTRQLQPTWYPHSHEVEGSAAIILSPARNFRALKSGS